MSDRNAAGRDAEAREPAAKRQTRSAGALRVLLAGGGTAGHTSPLLATAAALQRTRPDVEITCLGTSRGLEVTLIPEAGLPLELVPPVPMPVTKCVMRPSVCSHSSGPVVS